MYPYIHIMVKRRSERNKKYVMWTYWVTQGRRRSLRSLFRTCSSATYSIVQRYTAKENAHLFVLRERMPYVHEKGARRFARADVGVRLLVAPPELLFFLSIVCASSWMNNSVTISLSLFGHSCNVPIKNKTIINSPFSLEKEAP